MTLFVLFLSQRIYNKFRCWTAKCTTLLYNRNIQANLSLKGKRWLSIFQNTKLGPQFVVFFQLFGILECNQLNQDYTTQQEWPPAVNTTHTHYLAKITIIVKLHVSV